MVEAIVGVALRAVLASIVLGAALALCVLVATRALALTAAARHVLWTTALFAIGVMPLTGIGVSLWRGAVTSPASVVEGSASRRTTVPSSPVSVPRARSQRDTPRSSPHAQAPSGSAAKIRTASTASRENGADSAVGSSRVDRIAALRAAASGWTPRVSHALAVGAVAAWALGALIGFIGLVASVLRVRGLKRRSSPLDGTLPDELPWLTEVGPGREIYLRLSYETETPVAIGFGRPVILIPTELATAAGLSAIEQLILHEHAHLCRYDDWTNLAQRSIERLFWFNPIVWFVGRRIALEREIASDDAVVEKTGEAHQYATSLWKLVREMRMPEHAVVAPGALLTRKQISVRIEQLLDANRARRHGSPLAATGVALAAVLAVGLVGTSAPAVELPAPPAQLAASALPAWTEGGVPPPGSASVNRTPKHATQHALRHMHYTNTRTERQITVAPQHTWMAPLPHLLPIAPIAPFPAQHLPALPAIPPIPAPSERAPSEPAPSERAPIGAGEAIAIAGEAGRVVHDAMAAIPMRIAQEQAGVRTRQAPRDGTKITRELIASCTACSLEHADLRGLDLHGLRIAADELSHADLRNVNLAGAQLVGVSLEHANLAGADLRGARLSGVALEGANFDGARLDGVKLIGVSLQHVSLRGTTMRSVLASCTGCDMQGMDLRGQDLHNIALTGADLSNANLRDANLSGVRFTAVDLSNAQLDGADLTNASFVSCDLSGASMHGAKTTGMLLRGSGPDG